MSTRQKNRIAATDSTFSYADGFWMGKCLICGGHVRFNAQTGFGATIEHIQPRNLAGTNALLNLGLTHPHCNNEKGNHWDPRRRRRQAPDAYRALIERLLAERQRRWRQPDGIPAE